MKYKSISRRLLSFTNIKIIIALLSLLVMLLQGAQPVSARTNHAVTLTVTNTKDHDPGSLRAAISNAISGDTIVFDTELAGQTIVLESMLRIDSSITIDGTSLSSHITISGDDKDHVFWMPQNVSYFITLKGLNIEHGEGAAILQRGVGTHLTIEDVVFSNNDNTSEPPIDWDWGGAIYNDGYLTVINSIFTDNEAGGGAVPFTTMVNYM